MQFTAQQIAALAGGRVDGNPDAVVHTIAKIEEGVSGAISFLANPKYTPYIYTTDSSVVLVKEDFVAEQPVKATLIRVADPYATVAHLLQMVAQMTAPKLQGIEQPSYIAEGVEIPADAYIGAFAYIGKGAKIGAGAKIYPHAYVGDGAEIGEETVLNSGVKVYHGCRIGKRCIIHSGAVIGADGFGFAPTADGSYDKIPQIGNVVVEDDVEIGANTSVDRATMGSTRICKGVKLDNLIQVAHNVVVGESTVMAAQVGVAGSTKIGAHCMVGGQAGFAGHIEIGDKCVFGAQAGITNNVAPGRRMIGSPAIDGRQFARELVYVKSIPDLQRRISLLEKKADNESNKPS